MTFGAMELAMSPTRAGRQFTQLGLAKAPVRRVHHEMTESGVRLVLPAGGLLTDAEARRLAWAILSDLAPEDVIPTPEVVTYSEAQRLAVVRVLANGPCTAKEAARALEWGLRSAQRRLSELVADGRAAVWGTACTASACYRLRSPV